MAISSEAAIKIKVRLRCDGADTDLLPDDALDNYLDDAVERLSEINARLMMSTFTTVADQQDYQITGGGAELSNFLGLEDVLYDQSNSGFLNDEFPSLWSLGAYGSMADGISVFDNPSLVEIHAIKSRKYDEAFNGNWELVDKAGSSYIRLISAPGVGDDSIPYFWWQKRTLTDMEDRFEQKLIDLCVAYCLQSIGSRLSMHPEISFGGFKGRSSGEHAIKRGEKLERRTEGRLYRP